MHCCVTDLRDKKVINSKNACIIGYVCDVEIDSCSGKVANIVVARKGGALSFFCKDEAVRICWEEIDVIGDEAILVCKDFPVEERVRKKNLFEGLFR